MARAKQLFITIGALGSIGVLTSGFLYFVFAEKIANHSKVPADDWCGQSRFLIQLLWQFRAVSLFKFSVGLIFITCLFYGFHSIKQRRAHA